jgi:hypothetical protein
MKSSVDQGWQTVRGRGHVLVRVLRVDMKKGGAEGQRLNRASIYAVDAGGRNFDRTRYQVLLPASR